MAYANTTWATRDPIIASKLQQMSDNDSYLKAQVDSAPRGILAISKRETPILDSVGQTTTPLNGLSITFTVAAARTVKITFYVRSFSSNVANTVVGQQILDGSNASVNELNVWLENIGIGTGGGPVSAILQLSAGTYTYKGGAIVNYSDNMGTTLVSMQASAVAYAYIMAEDIGPTVAISTS